MQHVMDLDGIIFRDVVDDGERAPFIITKISEMSHGGALLMAYVILPVGMAMQVAALDAEANARGPDGEGGDEDVIAIKMDIEHVSRAAGGGRIGGGG